MLVPLAPAAQQPADTVELRRSICQTVDGVAVVNRLSPAFLTRILWQESRFHPDARSLAGAEGVAQFMPQTASERGLSDPRSVSLAIAEAARLLAELTNRFGNIGLAAAAYNAGAGRVSKWRQAQSELPVETSRYVLAVTGRRVEEWLENFPPAQHIVRTDERPCLEVVAELARSGSGGSEGSVWQTRLDRILARARALAVLRPRGGPELK